MVRMVTGKDKGTSDVEKSEKAATVLVADDDASVRTFIRTALEQIGLKVGEASNGAEALQQFEALRPDIIVLDVMMPIMDGYVACSRLRGSVHGSCLPILMMTGLDDVAAAYEHGATDFITKPLNLTDFEPSRAVHASGSRTLDALLRSEARLGLAQRIAKIGNWEWQPQTGQFTASSELYRLMGIRPQDFGGTLDAFLDAIDDEGRDPVRCL